ncbi:MAG: winged helix-turn-helix transcriptional regulator [Anaerolineae bacterium]|nr:winged helix-turn-helix transcriptional regulator [Anaerolineae bacterium]
MLPENETEIKELTAVLKALAEPNRMRIFAELMQGDSCNCELQERLGLARNLLSHHFRILENAGLVHSRRDQVDGRWIYYSVDRAAATRWHDWFNHFLDPAHIQERTVCGPEGQLISTEQVFLSLPS